MIRNTKLPSGSPFARNPARSHPPPTPPKKQQNGYLHTTWHTSICGRASRQTQTEPTTSNELQTAHCGVNCAPVGIDENPVAKIQQLASGSSTNSDRHRPSHGPGGPSVPHKRGKRRNQQETNHIWVCSSFLEGSLFRGIWECPPLPRPQERFSNCFSGLPTDGVFQIRFGHGCFALRRPWFTWWFNHLPGPSICHKEHLCEQGTH